MIKFILFSCSLLLLSINLLAFEVKPTQELSSLFKRFDRDQDKKITVEDKIPENSLFILTTSGEKKLSVQGTYPLSNLAQELKIAQLTGAELNGREIFINPVDRISYVIKERFWNGLTRRIDASTLDQVIEDPKIKSEKKYLYVPFSDETTYNYYKKLAGPKLEVVKLPQEIPSGFILSLGKKQGLLSLALKDGQGVPYVVPGGRFNEMYGWDSFFHTLGTMNDGRVDLARGMVENMVYQINHYGKILNANRTYYLSRSQPPFLTSMIRAVYPGLPQDKKSLEWLGHALKAAIKEYETVWMGKDRLTPTGLSRYAGFDEGIPPEVEPGHFNEVLKPFALKHKKTIPVLMEEFNRGKIQDPELKEFFYQDRALRESGHDTTFRFRTGGKDRAADFVTVDLNSLLYKYELDIALLIDQYFEGVFEQQTAQHFYQAALKRRELMKKFLWNKEKGLFFDYNWKEGKISSYLSATTLYPLWAGHGHEARFKLLSLPEAKRLLTNALKELEQNGGLSATAEVSLKRFGDSKSERQWEYPNGWAPHQILAWIGLKEYGFHRDAHRLIYKWLYMMTRNFRDYHGTIPEKYDVVSMSHKVFSEYGNVGTKFSYITMEGFGWMNASYQLGLKELPGPMQTRLRNLTPPEWLRSEDTTETN